MEKEITYRHNVMNINSVDAFLNIRGGFSQRRRDVYFVRALGCRPDTGEYILAADRRMGAGMLDGGIFYTRVGKLPVLTRQEDAGFYQKQFDKLRSQRELYVKNLKESEKFGRVLGEACLEALKQYRMVRNGMTESIERNFVVKLLYWTDRVLGEALSDWNERKCFKILADNVCKEQEYLFYFMLTLIGCDVLLLQCREDIVTADAVKSLSGEFKLGEFREIQFPEYKPCREKQIVQKPESLPPQSSGKMEKSFEELALLASSIVMIEVHDHRGEAVSTGSGIMIGKDGYILTNHHVAGRGRFFSVRIEDDDKIYRTDEMIKYNSVLDLAVIRINRQLKPLPVYKGGKKLVRGQKVVAIGSPLGLFNSVSDGIISGFRQIESVDMIQFTAPISHGSSGGAVLNMQGEVIGISTAGIDQGQNLNLAVDYKSINMFIRGFVG